MGRLNARAAPELGKRAAWSPRRWCRVFSCLNNNSLLRARQDGLRLAQRVDLPRPCLLAEVEVLQQEVALLMEGGVRVREGLQVGDGLLHRLLGLDALRVLHRPHL